MAAPLSPVSIAAPGFYGLNTQDSSVSVGQNFALVADNAVIDSYGRVGARKGYEVFSDTDSSDIIYCIHEHVNRDGTTALYASGGANFYSIDETTGAVTSEYTDSTSPAEGNWQAMSFNNSIYFFRENQGPIVNEVGGSGWAELTSYSTMPTGVTTAGVGLSAYGRIWMARTNLGKTTVYWSDTLIGTDFISGTAGAIDLELVFTNGTDEITHLAAFNGRLVIFCKKSIVIYSGAEEPATMKVEDVIDGVGCVARDSVQDIGTDILFLSDTGLRSLGRVIQEKSAPMKDISRNVRDNLLTDAASGNIVKSAYYEKDAFYLLSVPALQKVWCFDLRSQLEDGSFRVTTWSGVAFSAFCTGRDRNLYIATSLRVSKYGGYQDNGSAYTFSYYTTNLDAGATANLKMLKAASFIVVGGSDTTMTVKWDVDYGSNYASRVFSFPASSSGEYNVDEYTVAEYSIGNIINRKSVNLSKTGRVFQLGFEAQINGSPLSIQQIEILVKGGRTV